MFDLSTWLSTEQNIIDEALDSVLPSENATPCLLHKAMRYSVFTGGKRIRPILCRAAVSAVSGAPDAGLMPGVAIELLHTYTLIHDDLPSMDNDDFRRGQPTSHRKFGEANAILAGDALQTLAFELMARTPAPAPYPATTLVSELATAAGSLGVVGGQIEDINHAGRNPTAEQISFVHMHKTAMLFRAAMRIGAITAAATDKQLETLTTYGTSIGLAFQITDDLLDNAKETTELTCLSIFSPEQAAKKADELISSALSSIADLHAAGAEPLAAIARFIVERKH